MNRDEGVAEAVAQLREASAAKKCWGCGCFHQAVAAVERALPDGECPTDLDAALRTARERLTPVKYDCLGCDVCYPAVALNALHRADVPVEPESCPTEPAEARAGWPPLPGNYTVRRYRAPVAVCALTDDGLAATVDREAGPEVSIVGTLQTENLGIERLILNVVANPNIRFLVVTGADSRQRIGHLPGQSLLALARSGVDDRSRIVGAQGKRPVLRNIEREAVAHFRRNVDVVDLVGTADIGTVLDAVYDCAKRNPGPAQPFASARSVEVIAGALPDQIVPDRAGYFVVYVDRTHHLLSLEHYRMDGVLDVIVEGCTAAEIYVPAVERGLLSRLDHAAYLGRELARAEHALLSGAPYVQDGAPERRQPGVPAPGAPCCNATCTEVS